MNVKSIAKWLKCLRVCTHGVVACLQTARPDPAQIDARLALLVQVWGCAGVQVWMSALAPSPNNDFFNTGQ
jgi:hypothetical protein